MELDIAWILLGLPIAFGMGWLMSRLDLRQLRIDNKRSPKAYFKGLNYLLNEQQDLAIDAFIEAVQNDPDTSELHFALGNLFRRRGEYDRAVRVHEHLLARGDLKQHERDRAQHALSLDFMKAGLLDRAEDAMAKLEGTQYGGQARLARLAIYERTRDWKQAAVVANQLQNMPPELQSSTPVIGDMSVRISHYLTEQAQGIPADQAQNLLYQAISTAPHAARPRIALSQLQQEIGQPTLAYKTLLDVMEYSPSATPLIADNAQKLATQCGFTQELLQKLEANYHQSASIDVLEAIVKLQAVQPGMVTDSARQRYVQHLEREPSLTIAARWMQDEKLEHEQFHPQVQRALDKAVKPLLQYRCAACGFSAHNHFWQCPGCQSWDSYPARRVEEL